ncbi:hypothetical protein LTR10_010613 [Elasticomyces elasticus]|nr:hypothetical protein LTR10_010613 [Elasticomyces elasticus]KAK4968219.1 hypothetical protein LTR42_009502 [Elasticomyces elasticus]
MLPAPTYAPVQPPRDERSRNAAKDAQRRARKSAATLTHQPGVNAQRFGAPPYVPPTSSFPARHLTSDDRLAELGTDWMLNDAVGDPSTHDQYDRMFMLGGSWGSADVTGQNTRIETGSLATNLIMTERTTPISVYTAGKDLDLGATATRLPFISSPELHRFVILEPPTQDNIILALGITTYNGQGVAAHGVVKRQHSIIYSHGSPTSLPCEAARVLPDGEFEIDMMETSILVHPYAGSPPLDRMACLDLATIHRLQIDMIDARIYGKVATRSWPFLMKQHHSVLSFMIQKLQYCYQAPVPPVYTKLVNGRLTRRSLPQVGRTSAEFAYSTRRGRRAEASTTGATLVQTPMHGPQILTTQPRAVQSPNPRYVSPLACVRPRYLWVQRPIEQAVVAQALDDERRTPWNRDDSRIWKSKAQGVSAGNDSNDDSEDEWTANMTWM